MNRHGQSLRAVSMASFSPVKKIANTNKKKTLSIAVSSPDLSLATKEYVITTNYEKKFVQHHHNNKEPLSLSFKQQQEQQQLQLQLKQQYDNNRSSLSSSTSSYSTTSIIYSLIFCSIISICIGISSITTKQQYYDATQQEIGIDNNNLAAWGIEYPTNNPNDGISFHPSTVSSVRPDESQQPDGRRKDYEVNDDTDCVQRIVFGNDRIPKSTECSNNNNSTSSNSDYAYAFLIGGVDPTFERKGYRGFLYNVLVASYILKQHYNSRYDIWVLIQMQQPSNTTNVTTFTNDFHYELPYTEQMLLQKQGVHIWYLPPSSDATFATTVFEKFRILQMIEYKRVMFLDADIIPTTNLDYLLELTDVPSSDRNDRNVPLLQPNVIIATRGEAANAGLFILQPKVGAYQTIVTIIDRQHRYAIERNLSYPYFERSSGWGHTFYIYNDKWEGIIQEGNYWDYFASHSDQGLLYYYTKYYEQQVSIIRGDTVENWERNTTTQFRQDNIRSTKQFGRGHTMPIRTKIYNTGNEIYRISKKRANTIPIHSSRDCNRFNIKKPKITLITNRMGTTVRKYDFFCYPPYRHYKHFVGKSKPWQQDLSATKYYIQESIKLETKSSTNNNNDTSINDSQVVIPSSHKQQPPYQFYSDPYVLWFHTLRKIIQGTDSTMLNDNNTTTGNITKNTTVSSPIEFLRWWGEEYEHIKDSPLGYMALYSQHASKVLSYQRKTTSSTT